MTPPRADASSSDPATDAAARIAELEADIARLNTEKAERFAEEQALRQRESQAERVSFAQEIFQLQRDQRRMEVEILLLETKIRRLRLGYDENACPTSDSCGGLLC